MWVFSQVLPGAGELCCSECVDGTLVFPNKTLMQQDLLSRGMTCDRGAAAGEGHHISFNFQMPSLMSEYRKKAEDYWGHVLGHEGPGSLLSALKARRWATGLSAGMPTHFTVLVLWCDGASVRSMHADFSVSSHFFVPS